VREVFHLSGLVQRYNGLTVLRVDELKIARAAILGLVGPNGSGKSSLLRILALIEPPAEGKVVFDGRPADFDSARDRRRVSLLLQDPYLLQRKVFDNVAYGPQVRGEKERLKERVAGALELVGLEPARFAHRSWRELSGGEAQRVALAARLVLRPEVLLLDEPTASVDAASAVLIKEAALAAVRGWGTTLVIASHDLAWLEEVADETIHLFEGRPVPGGLNNLLLGPWETDEKGRTGLRLADGQVILVPGQRGRAEPAVVDPARISVSLERPAAEPGLNLLQGLVTRLGLSLEGGRVTVTVSVGGLKLTAALDRRQVEALGLLPGREVWLGFAWADMTWLGQEPSPDQGGEVEVEKRAIRP